MPPFDNQFTKRQQRDITYRLLDSADLRAQKNTAQSGQLTASKGPSRPAPSVKPQVQKSGPGEGSLSPSREKSKFSADLGEVTLSDLSDAGSDPTGLALSGIGFAPGPVGIAASVIGTARTVSRAVEAATSRRENERMSRRESFQQSMPDAAPITQQTGAKKGSNGQDGMGGKEKDFGVDFGRGFNDRSGRGFV